VKAGPRFEARVCRYLTDQGLPCERRVQGGARDRGDIAGLPGWTLELKNNNAISLGTAMNEAKEESGHAGTSHYGAIHNRRNHSLERSYVTIELWEFARLLRIERQWYDTGVYRPGLSACGDVPQADLP
jgi:hypothetical protein